MPTRRSPLLLPLVLLACTDRPLGDTETSTAGPSTSDAPQATATTADPPGTATTPTTTATPPLPTTATTDAPATTTIDPSATTAIDPSGTTVDPGTSIDPSGTTTLDPQAKLDLPEPLGTAGLVGCHLDAPAGTMVSGASTIGPFAAQRAYFAYAGFGDEPFMPVLLFVSPTADPAIEVQQPNGATGPILHSNVFSDTFLEGGWIGAWPASANVFAEGMIGDISRPDGVTIDARAGNWDAPDPADPPRLIGSLQGGITGPFDAVFCDKLVIFIIPE